MSTDVGTYTIRGESLTQWGLEDSPELRRCLEDVERDAFEAGCERGEQDTSEGWYQQGADDARDELKLDSKADTLALIVERLAILAIDYAVASGTALTMPDAHEAALRDMRDELTTIAHELRG